MRWQRILILGAAAAAMAATSIPAVAAPPPVLPITGSVVVAGTPVAGATVRLLVVLDGPVAGAVVDTAVTAANGTFALLPDTDPAIEEYAVFVVADDEVQGGYVGGGASSGVPAFTVPELVDGATYAAGSAIGPIEVLNSYLRGTVVDSVTKAPVPGVVVTARDEVDRTIVYGRDTTNARGVFVITGLSRDEYSLRMNGLRVGYENGYRACDRTVLPWLDACTLAPGKTGRTLIDQL